jgi:hypothetical protein
MGTHVIDSSLVLVDDVTNTKERVTDVGTEDAGVEKEDDAESVQKQSVSSEESATERGKALTLEVARLLITLTLDIVCTVYVWNGRLEPGYATAAIILKDWISDLAIESKNETTARLSDMFRDLHCDCLHLFVLL